MTTKSVISSRKGAVAVRRDLTPREEEQKRHETEAAVARQVISQWEEGRKNETPSIQEQLSAIIAHLDGDTIPLQAVKLKLQMVEEKYPLSARDGR